MASDTSPRTVWSFSTFELDSATGELRRSGVLIRLPPPQALRVLLALLEKPGELVSRAELRNRLWHEGTFVEFDGSLNFCLSRLRGALGDDARRPLFVETLPGRGYRFIAPVRVRREPEAAPAAPLVPRRRLAPFAAVMLLALPPHTVASSATRAPGRCTGTPARCVVRKAGAAA